MSISTFQEKLFKGGCGMGVLMFCAAVMIGGVFYTSCMGASRGGNMPEGQGQAKVAFTVGGTPVDADMLTSGIQSRLDQKVQEEAMRAEQNKPAPAGPTPFLEILATKEVVQGLITEAARGALVQKLGIKTDDAALTDAFNSTFEEQMRNQRDQLTMMGQLKPNASDAEFDAAIKKLSGKTLAEIKASAQSQLQQNLSDKGRRASLVITLAPQLLLNELRKKYNPSDAELKASYDQLTLKKLTIRDTTPGKAPAATRIAEAEKAIQGGMSFEQAVDKYTDDTPFGGKKASEQTTDMRRADITSDPNLKPLLTLTPGQVSPAVTIPGGKAIFKLVSIKNEAPKDFDAQKAKYRKEYVDRLAGGELTDQLQKLLDSPDLVKFNSKGYQAFYDVLKAQQAGAPGSKETLAKMQAAYDEAKAAQTKNDVYDSRVATLARFAANSYLWGASASSDKTKLMKERIDTLESVLQSSENFDLRMELFSLYQESKDLPHAADQLLQASKNNATYDTLGFQRWGQVRDKMLALQQDKTAPADVLKAIETSQLEWSRRRTEYERQQEELKKEQAKAEAEAKKNAPPTPAPGGTTPAPGSTAPTGGTTGGTTGAAPAGFGAPAPKK